MKRLLWGVVGLIVLLLVGLGALRLWLALSVPPLGGREHVGGLADSVLVLWDSLAVPHLSAGSEADLFTAVGYVHARDRIWQMDLSRHAAEGRLSELFGDRAVRSDRRLRALELRRIARAHLAAASPETRHALEAYARGVNAWIARGRYRAVEFRILGHHPEPWRAEHSVEIGRLQSWDLRTTGADLALRSAAARPGPYRAALLAPTYPDTAPTIIPRGAWRPTKSVVRRPSSVLDVPTPDARDGQLTTDDGRRAAASNSWVLGPGRTASRRPILANDPHLTLRAPSVWYLIGAHAPGYEVVGATIPGAPVVILGHTARLGWGFTNAMVDDVDYFVEELSPDSMRYRDARGWADVEAVAETILVRGGTPLIYRRLRTANGPLIERESGGPPLAMRWVAQDASDEISALRGMGRATNWNSFAAAVERFRSPEQNVVYADADGNIAYMLAGHVPVRRGAARDPQPGSTGAGQWQRYLTPAELPRHLNPPEGFIVTANNRIIGDEYPFYISGSWEQPYRAQRIIELVRQNSAATAQSVGRAQLDAVDVFCRAIAPLAARAALAAGRAEVADRLRAWDGSMAPDRTEPTLVWSWYRELERLVYDSASPGYRPLEPLDRWIAEGRSAWSNLPALERRAMERVLPQATNVPWGSVHRTVQEHPLGAVPLLGRLLGFTLGPFPNGGGNYTVNVASTDEDVAPFESSWGPSLRHVVDFGHVDDAGGLILPTGQSGHPLSRHYRDQTERWLRGELWTVPLDLGRVRVVSRLILVPEVR
ncbi:MAG TPA: penicillin acylase family protein [Gemmatimonadales bacterium]|nr:penicillin acylase family protein [Gemmatimonadales bacterium]